MDGEQGGRVRRGPAAPAGRWALAAAVVVVLLLGATAVALAGGSGGGSESEPSTRETGTGTVARRTLAERLTATGTIGYAGETTVIARLSGTVTALPAIGDVIRRGGRLYALSAEPVLLMYGALPAYRALAAGIADGRDVEQLERNLTALGFDPGTVDEEFTEATAAAVGDWQEAIGLEATGEVELGRVAFLRGPQRVTRLEATLGEGIGGGGSGSEPGSNPTSTPVLRSSSTRRIVGVELEADRQSIARRGQKVAVVLPGGAEVPGVVRALSAVELPAGGGNQGEEAEPGVAATIAVTGRHRIPGLDGATVSVLFTQQVRRDVLSVPLTALVAIGGGRFAIYVREDGARRRLFVTPGLAADGYAQVEGEGLRAGMTVETGE